jgi:FkbM family methyltransferase
MKKYLEMVDVKGIIQVGACNGQEISLLENFTKNIMLIEPHPHLANFLKVRYPEYKVIETALGNENNESDFYTASNGESSSLLKPHKHIKFHPTITFNDIIKVKVQRFEDMKIDISGYNVLITDTQGTDLDVLKGFGSLINNIDLIISEYINSDLYYGNQGLNLFVEYLKNFKLIETFDENQGAGNAVFKRITNV